MKIKNFLIPGVVIVALVATISQVFSMTPEGRNEKRRLRAENEKVQTKAYLEQNARSEIDYLSKRYDMDILQDQLNKNKLPIPSSK